MNTKVWYRIDFNNDHFWTVNNKGDIKQHLELLRNHQPRVYEVTEIKKYNGEVQVKEKQVSEKEL